MEIPQILGNLAQFYIITICFYGMLFGFREISNNPKIRPDLRLPYIVVFLLLNLMTGNLIFLIVGVYGAAWTTTERQERKRK